MIRKRLTPWMLLLALIFLSGCWDIDYLRDFRLVVIAGFDRNPDGKIMETVAVRYPPATFGSGSPTNITFEGIGNSVREARKNIAIKTNGRIRTSKNRVLLLGERLAKKGIYDVLDVLYRDPKSALSAHIAVTRGTAKDIITINQIGSTLIGKYIDELIESNETKSIVEKHNIESIFAYLMDPLQDFAIPYLTSDGKDVKVSGMAMFHGHRMTGILTPDESILYLMMKGKNKSRSDLTIKIGQNERSPQRNFISIDIRKTKPKMDVKVHGNKIDVTFVDKLKVEVGEYPPDQLEQEEHAKKLSSQLSAILTKRMNSLLKKMQKAHFDGFGVARHLKAFHYEDFKKIDFEKEFPHIHFQAKAIVEISDYGIIS